MSVDPRNNIGYFVAAFGAMIMLVTLWLLYAGTLPVTDSKGILIMLIIVSALLIALGMYVIVPKDTHDAITDLSGAAKDILPYRFARAAPPPPQVVHPEAGQTTVVVPPAPDDKVEVPVPESAPPPPPDPEVATGAALPLLGPTRQWQSPKTRSVPRTPATPITPGMRRRQDLYPPGEA